MTRINKQRMTAILGQGRKPTKIWQRQFDGFDDQLQRMGRCDWEQAADGDLWYYLHDLAYQPLQPDLFRHLFPRCLQFWYDTLMRNEGAEWGDADFHYALMRGAVLEKMMSDQQRQDVYSFFVDGFLDRIDVERGFEYNRPGTAENAWIWRFNTLGIVAPIIADIWQKWWAFDTPGQAVSAIKYASGLIYLKGENPIYLPWTGEGGGGGPYMTECDAGLYDWGWQPVNLRFLKTTLSSDYIVERLSSAAGRLEGEPEARIARRIAAEAVEQTDIIQIRIEDMLENLARRSLEQDFWE